MHKEMYEKIKKITKIKLYVGTKDIILCGMVWPQSLNLHRPPSL